MVIFDLILLILSVGMVSLGIYFINHKRVQKNLEQVVLLLGGAFLLAGVLGIVTVILS